MNDRLPHYQDAIADSYGPALEGEQLEAWMRAQEDLALERELRAAKSPFLAGIQPPYGIVPSPAPVTTVHVTKRLTLEDLARHCKEPIALTRPRPFQAAARVLAERMTRDMELLERWRTIEELAHAQGVDYERPASRRKSIPTQPPMRSRGGRLFAEIYFTVPIGDTIEQRLEALDREQWLESCTRRLQGALTRHALLGDALATIHQAWQHDGDVVLELVRNDLEAW